MAWIFYFMLQTLQAYSVNDVRGRYSFVCEPLVAVGALRLARGTGAASQCLSHVHELATLQNSFY